MNNTTKPHLNFIDYLKAIAIFMVILHHVLYQYNETVAGLTETGNLVLLLCYFTHVPLFFVIAGFLSRPQAVGAYYRKRVTQLMIPFFFFSILKLIFTILAEREFAFGKIGGMVSQFFLVGTQYWFVYAMLGVSLVAPLLWKCAESMGRFLLPIGGVVLLLCRKWLNGLDEGIIDVFQFRQMLRHLPFFMIGMSCRVFATEIQRLKRYAWILVAGCAAVVVYYGAWYYNGSAWKFVFPDYVLTLSMMYLLLVIAKMLSSDVWFLKITGRYSLQLMFLDSFIRNIIFIVIAKVITCQFPWYYCIIIAVVDLIIGNICCRVAERIKMLAFLFGLSSGRGLVHAEKSN